MLTGKPLLVSVFVLNASLVGAAAATAEPAGRAKLGAGTYTAKWQGTGSGILVDQQAMDNMGCQSGIHECHDTLIEVREPGTLTVKTSSTDPKAADTDLQLFASDPSGKVGAQLQESAQPTPTPAEEVSARVKAGYFIARIDYALAANGVVVGEATLKPAVAAPDPGGAGGGGGGGPGGSPPADAPPSVTVAKPRSRKVRRFTGTAADDRGVAKVEVGVLKLGKKRECKELDTRGGLVPHAGRCTESSRWITAKGTTTWSLTLRKALPKGKYLVFARATDTAGQTQGGYGSVNRKRFTSR